MPGRRLVEIRKLRFVTYDKKLRGEQGRANKGIPQEELQRAFFSTEIAEAPKGTQG